MKHNIIAQDWIDRLAEDDFGIVIYGRDILATKILSDGILVINSLNMDDERFSLPMIRAMIRLVRNNDLVVASSSLDCMEDEFMFRYGLSYDSKFNVYYKGVNELWDGK